MYEKHSHRHCINQAIDQAKKICEDNCVTLTSLRKRVLEIVWANHGPVKAYDILDQLGDEKGTAKPPTVYRSLEFLTKNGLVHKLNSLNSYVGCSHPDQCGTCYFLICTQCEEVRECCNHLLEKAIINTAQDYDFKLSRVTLEIQGLCEHCRE